MKKGILVSCTAIIAIISAIFGLMNFSTTNMRIGQSTCAGPNEIHVVNPPVITEIIEEELFLKVDSRFINTITKENLHEAKSVVDIYPSRATEFALEFNSIELHVNQNGEETMEYGENEDLNDAQLNLIKTTGYHTNLQLNSYVQLKNPTSGLLETKHLTYAISVVPEKQAQYLEGQNELYKHIRENTASHTAVYNPSVYHYQPGKVRFTITAEGTLVDAKLTSTSGYDELDELLLELVNSLPANWEPAMNAKGERVDQQLVLFFGNFGC